MYASQSEEIAEMVIFRASKRNFLVFEMGFWISEVDGREGAHSRRSALPRPPSADTDASNTVGSSERRAVGSPRFQLRAGLRVRSPGRISLLELSKATFHVVLSRRRRVDGSRARARAPGRRARPPRRCRQAQRVDAQGTPTHRTRHLPSARRFRTRGAWLAPRRVVAEGTIYYVASRVLVVSPRRRIAPTELSRDVPTYPDDPASSRARLTTPNAAPRTASNTR